MSQAPELFVSTDIEADGPCPGPHSMLSVASAVFTRDGRVLDTFAVNLEPLPGASPHPVTERWWQSQPQAWEACRRNPEAPDSALPRYRDWLRSLPGRPVFVGYPASFDFLFVGWYLMAFTGDNPFGFAALDIKTYAMALFRTDFHATVRRRFPPGWFDDRPHTHVALDDALEQGALLCNLFRYRDALDLPEGFPETSP